jgi:perosamine synthetase
MKVMQFAPYLGKEEYKAIAGCFKRNWITEGPLMKDFESRLHKLIGSKYGVFAPNGTLALYLGLKAMGIKPGDEVIVPDFTFIGSATAVQMNGAVPVFVDVNRRNFQIDTESCQRAVSPKTKAIMPVHIYGMAANMDKVRSFAKKNKLMIIEDAAQAVGVKYKGQHCGTFGEVGCFSFFADKTITTGEGGFIVTNKKSIYEDLLYLRNQGRISRGTFIHPHLGYNFRMTDIQMAIGIEQLKKLPEIVSRKMKIYNLYRKELAGVKEITFTELEPGSSYIPFRVAIIAKNAHELMAYTETKGVQSRTFFYPLHRQPCFQYLKEEKNHGHYLDDDLFPNTLYGYNNGVCLPSFVSLQDRQIKYVCAQIKEFYKHG